MTTSQGPSILTTTVGSYPLPEWLAARPGAQALLDATRAVFAVQREAGIDLPTDGELYRFDPDHPETNGMIDWFLRRLSGVRTALTRTDVAEFRRRPEMGFRARPAAVVEGPLGEGTLDLPAACARAARVACGPFKFTLTSPYMLARTLLDRHHGSLAELTLALAEILADQAAGLECACLQVDEANLPGRPEDSPLAADAINRILDRFPGEKAVHLCFGNYGGQCIQSGSWQALLGFLGALRADHLVLEMARRSPEELASLRHLDSRLALGIGVIDVKVNHIESPEEVAAALERAERALGPGRLRWAHPDCGFWMLLRSVADRKLAALVAGRDLYLGRR